MSSQSASQSGHHNVIVQNHGDNVCVQLGFPHLRLVPVEARVQKSVRSEIDVLNPAFQSVPLVGRERDLHFLHNWLTADKRIAITVLTGSGGSGKSRLALEFLQQLPPEWQGGFLTADEAERFVSQENLSEWSWQRPTLIIADYAAMMSKTLSRWFAALADHIVPSHALRILLLERHANIDSGWYQSLTDATWQGQRIRELFWPNVPRQLSKLDSTVNRRAVLQAGLNAAATLAPALPIPLMPPYGEDKWFDQRLRAVHWSDPLMLLMAGIIARTDGFNAALSLARPQLAKQLALRERDRIRKSVEGQVAKDLITHLYACVTLCDGLPYDEAIQVSEAEFSALHRQYPGGAGQAVEDLAKVIGSHDTLLALTPSLLGEALLITTLGSKGIEVTERLSLIAPAEVATCLVRSTQDFVPYGDTWPLDWLMRLIAAGLSSPRLLIELEVCLPEYSLALGEGALLSTWMLARAFDTFIRHLGVPTGEQMVILAEILNRLSVRQHQVGRRAESLASAQESVRIFRTLTASDPNFYLSYLATSLTNLAHSQSILGQTSEALDSISEAVKIDRMLAGNVPGAHLSALSTSLGSQSLRYSETGQFQEALSAITESVTIRRELADSDPERFLPDLAMSLNTQASHLRSLDRVTEALASTTEAVSIHQSLAEANPDAYRVEFARSLNSHGAILGALGRHFEALEFVTQAVDIRHSLAEGNPDAFLPDLGRSLHNLGLILKRMGKHKDAATLFAEAVRCYRDSIETNTDPTRPWLATALHSLAEVQLSLEQHPEALASILEATQIVRTLAKEHPDLFLQNLSDVLYEQASIQRELHRYAESLISLAELVDVCRELATLKPNHFQTNLARALIERAVNQSIMRQHSNAIRDISEAVQIYRKSDDFLPDLANALHLLAQTLYWNGEQPKALAATEEAVRTVRGFKETHTFPYFHDLGLSLNSLAIQQTKMGAFAEALLSITEAVQLRRTVAEYDPKQYLADLAASLNNQAGIQASLGQHDLAYVSSVEAVQHYRTAVQCDPAEVLPYLAGAISALGNHSEAIGLLREARDCASECLTILMGLPSGQPIEPDNLAQGTFVEYKDRSQRLSLPLDEAIVKAFARLIDSKENSND